MTVPATHLILHTNTDGWTDLGPVDLSTSEVTGNLGVSHLNSATGATSSTFWRGDGTWGTPAGSVAITGTPANGNLTKFSGASSITNGDLTGDITTSGTLATTLATVNSNVGSFGSATQVATFTVNAKGLTTAAGNVTITAPTLQTGRTISITGDLAYTSPAFDGSGNVTAAGTLATVNSNVGTFGDASNIAQFTVNAKGLITAASNVAITVPAGANPTGTIGLSAVNGVATTFLRSDGAPALSQAITPTWTAQHAWSYTSTASTPASLWTGAIFTGGSGTTTFPHVLIQPAGTTAATGWSTSGTAFGINVPTGFAGNFIDWRLAGVQKFRVQSDGQMLAASINVGDISSTSGNVGSSVSSQWRLNGSSSTFQLYNIGTISWSSNNTWFGTNDLFLTRRGAANLQLGAADAASPVAQLLTAQGSRSGTDSNVAGGNLTIQAGRGTGNATGSSLVFQAPVAVASGSGAQTQTTALTLTGASATVAVPLTTAAQTMTVASPLSVASGTNQRAGNATLVGGTVTVSNTTVTANTMVMLTRKTSGGTIGTAITYTVSAATSFTITSDNILDTSTFSYFLIEVP